MVPEVLSKINEFLILKIRKERNALGNKLSVIQFVKTAVSSTRSMF